MGKAGKRGGGGSRRTSRLSPEHEAWKWPFLHFYPGLTPERYGELDLDDWARGKAFLQALTRGRNLPQP